VDYVIFHSFFLVATTVLLVTKKRKFAGTFINILIVTIQLNWTFFHKKCDQQLINT